MFGPPPSWGVSHDCNIPLPDGVSRRVYPEITLHRLTTLLVVGVCASALPATSPSFAPGVEQGTVTSGAILEASGLVASRQNPGVLWTHNDSGFSATIYAISTNGQLLASWQIPDAYTGDTEDIAIGPGPRPDLDYIYLGDIGDNYLLRSEISVIRIPEPAVYLYATNDPPSRALGEAVTIPLTYPDGPFNAEALLSDPVTGDLFIATKNPDVASSRIYRASKANLDLSEPIQLEFVREVSFRSVSGGDISADGTEIILRRGSHAELWKRAPGQTVAQAFATGSYVVPLIGNPVEPNGEAVAFHPTGLGYYTLSEGYLQPVYFFRRTSSDAPVQPLTVMPPASTWRVYDQESPPDSDWNRPQFDDHDWREGLGKLGYGQGDERTLVDFGLDPYFKIITTYFRKTFVIDNPETLTHLTLRMLYSDGMAFYLNGTELWRRNLAPNAAFEDLADVSRASLESVWTSFPLPASLLKPGTNTFAVELHRADSYLPTMSFDVQMTALAGPAKLRLAGPPFQEGPDWVVPILGSIGAQVGIDASPDLTSWTYLGQTILTNGYGVYLDLGSAGQLQRFYRVHQP
jgi:hypothetical protein